MTCAAVYVFKRAMYGMGGKAGNVHVCDGKKSVCVLGARVCCVGGLIMESHES